MVVAPDALELFSWNRTDTLTTTILQLVRLHGHNHDGVCCSCEHDGGGDGGGGDDDDDCDDCDGY